MIYENNATYKTYETQKLDIEVKRGDTLNIVLDVSDNGSNYDFTGYDILCQVKRKPTDKTPVLTLNARYEEGKIILAKEALAMMVDAYNYYYDIQIVNQAGDLQTWVEGRLNVKQDVSDFFGYFIHLVGSSLIKSITSNILIKFIDKVNFSKFVSSVSNIKTNCIYMSNYSKIYSTTNNILIKEN